MKAVTLPNGERLTFPNETPDDEIIDSYFNAVFGVSEEPDEDPEQREAGFTGAFKESFFDVFDIPEAAAYLADPTEQTRKQLLEATKPEYEYQDFYDIGGLGDLGRYAREVLGGSLGAIAAPIGAGIVGAKFGPQAGIASFIGAGAGQYVPEYARRQALLSEESVQAGKGAIDPSATKIISGALASGAIDRVTLAAFPTLQRLFGQSGTDAAQEVASGVVEEFRTKGMEAAIGRLFSGSTIPQAAIRGGMIEGGQELVQNMVARASAGEDLASADAYKEYLASGVTGAFLGGGIGAVDVGIRRLQSSDPESLFGGKQTEEQRKKNVEASKQRIKDNTTVIDDAFNANAETYTVTPQALDRDFLTGAGLSPQGKAVRSTTKKGQLIGNVQFDVDTQLINEGVGTPKTTNDIVETSATYQTLYNTFKDKVNDLTRSSRKDRRPDADQQLQNDVSKMIPKLKGLAKVILNHAETNKLTTGKNKTPLKFNEEVGNTSAELRKSVEGNFEAANDAAIEIAQDHAKKERKDKEKKDLAAKEEAAQQAETEGDAKTPFENVKEQGYDKTVEVQNPIGEGTVTFNETYSADDPDAPTREVEPPIKEGIKEFLDNFYNRVIEKEKKNQNKTIKGAEFDSLLTDLEKKIGRDSMPRAKRIIGDVLARHGHILKKSDTGALKVTYNKNQSEAALARTADNKRYNDNIQQNRKSFDNFRNADLGRLTEKLLSDETKSKISNPASILSRKLETGVDLDPKIVNKAIKEIRTLANEMAAAETAGTINNPEVQNELQKLEASVTKLLTEAENLSNAPTKENIEAQTQRDRTTIEDGENGKAANEKLDDNIEDIKKDIC
jgi:hypothetical protein